ncbi:MAG: acyloxyacyl hydrolase [Acetobacteraceae bacterium]|nr:acyloxyacyl hydrolase [Acetobacteraceae bacterium]
MRAILGVVVYGALLLLTAGTDRAAAQQIVSEVRFGVLAHDVPFLGAHKEGGADLNGEIVFVSPIPDSAIANIPPLVRWMLQPRPNIGGDVNTAGATSQLYFGLVWTAPLAHDLFTRNDGLFLSLGLGPAFNNGKIATSQPDRKSLGSQVLFHPSVEFGYRFNRRYSVSLYYEHSSNAGLAQENEGLNNVGLRVGLAF